MDMEFVGFSVHDATFLASALATVFAPISHVLVAASSTRAAAAAASTTAAAACRCHESRSVLQSWHGRSRGRATGRRSCHRELGLKGGLGHVERRHGVGVRVGMHCVQSVSCRRVDDVGRRVGGGSRDVVVGKESCEGVVREVLLQGGNTREPRIRCLVVELCQHMVHENSTKHNGFGTVKRGF